MPPKLEPDDIFFKYKKGDVIGGTKIVDIVGRNGDFLVCTTQEDKGIGVVWSTRDKYSFTDEQHAQLKEFNGRYDAVCEVSGNNPRYVEKLAVCLYLALCSPDQPADVAFKEIDEAMAFARYKEKQSSKTRMIYGVSALVVTLLSVAIAGFDDGAMLSQDKGDASWQLLCASAMFGAVGAFASVLEKLRNLEALGVPSFTEAAFAGGMRILMGFIFGAVGYVAAHNGLILSALLKAGGGVLLIGFLSGISERLIPEMVRSIENRGSKSKS